MIDESIGYMNPMKITKVCHTAHPVPDDAKELEDMNVEARELHQETIHKKIEMGGDTIRLLLLCRVLIKKLHTFPL